MFQDYKPLSDPDKYRDEAQGFKFQSYKVSEMMLMIIELQLYDHRMTIV